MIGLGLTSGARRSKLRLSSPRGGAGNRWASNARAATQEHPSAFRSLLGLPRRLARALWQLADELRLRFLSVFGQAGHKPHSGERFVLPTTALVCAASAIVAASLTVVALRSDLTRVRYELSQASAELRQLDEEGRALTLELRKLHDPRRISEIAKARGFGPPERTVELP